MDQAQEDLLQVRLGAGDRQQGYAVGPELIKELMQPALAGVPQRDHGGIAVRLGLRACGKRPGESLQQPGHADLEAILGVAGEQVGCGQVGDDRAVGDHRDAGGQLLGYPELVGGQHHGLALITGQVGDPVLDRARGLHV